MGTREYEWVEEEGGGGREGRGGKGGGGGVERMDRKWKGEKEKRRKGEREKGGVDWNEIGKE